MTPAPPTIGRYRRSLRQFIMFGIVGGSGMVVNMIVTVLMNKANGGTQNAQEILFPIPGTEFNFRFTTLVWIVAFLVANLYNFLLNRNWTFGKGNKAPVWQEFWPFLVVGSVAAAAGVFIKLAFTNPVSPLYLSEPFWHEDAGFHSREYWSQLLTIVITMPINFVVNKLWTFRAVRNRYQERSADETAPGETAPGRTIPGPTAPGPTAPAPTAPAQTAPAQTAPDRPSPDEAEPGTGPTSGPAPGVAAGSAADTVV